MRFKLSCKGKKTNILKGKPKVAYSVALVLAFLSAENENWQLEDLPPADFGRLPERLLLSVRTKSINDNFVTWKLQPLLFSYSWLNAFSHLKSQRQRTLRLLFEDCRFTFIHLLMKSAFLPSKGLLWLYDKQNNTWLLVDIEFLSSCSTRHLTGSLRSLVSFRVKLSKRNSISTRAHVFSISWVFLS